VCDKVVSKMACDKVVLVEDCCGQRWRVTKLCWRRTVV
jgi:hypothetical protein